ncbi:MAG: hypothetical protein Q8L34_00215, partial [Candidatus Woesearchaeota archaeon]|nr:hypothetical protein [Candidatus Woesearchaeota archaeon]
MIATTGIRKTKTKLVVHFVKTVLVLDQLVSFLRQLGFATWDSNRVRSKLGDSDDNYTARSYSSELYQDLWLDWKSKEYEVEIFFGARRVILVVRGKTS